MCVRNDVGPGNMCLEYDLGRYAGHVSKQTKANSCSALMPWRKALLMASSVAIVSFRNRNHGEGALPLGYFRISLVLYVGDSMQCRTICMFAMAYVAGVWR
jgi:hypothetical protein